MGIPSTYEDIEERKNDAKFCNHEPAPDLKALKTEPVGKRPAKQRSQNLVDRLKREVARQGAEIAKLKKRLNAAEERAALERAHAQQLKERSNKSSNLLLEAENRRFRAELEAKNKELEGTRKLAMGNLFGKNA